MKAIILAAGQALRLRPLTEKTPKCLLRVRGQAILDYQISSLIRNGILEIVVVVGFEKEQIIKHLTENYPEIVFTFIENKDFRTTGPAYSLFLAKEHLKGDVLYLNADVLYGPNIIKRVRKTRKPSATAIQCTPWDEEAVNVITNKDGLIKEIGKYIRKEYECGEFIGVTKFDRMFNKKLVPALEYFVSQGKTNKFAADAINLAITRGAKMYAVDVTDLETLEIDTPEDLARAERMFGFFTRLKQEHPYFSAQGFSARVKRSFGALFNWRA